MLVKHILTHSKYAVMITALLALVPQRALAAGGAVESSDPGFGLLAGALVFAVLGGLLLGLGALAGRRLPERPPSKES